MDITVKVLPPETALLPSQSAAIEITIPELDVRQFISLPLDDFHRYFGYVSEKIEADLLIFCAAIYVTDQLISRGFSTDNWTRNIRLCVPARNPSLWRTVSDQLTKAVGILTGDNWTFEFTERKSAIYHGGNRHLKSEKLYPARTVCLFSGGLDSMTGAIDFLETQSESLVLVGHRGLGASAGQEQRQLWKVIDEHYPYRTNLIQARISRLKQDKGSAGLNGLVRNPAKPESTFRSRSIVFLGLGVYIANQLDFGERNHLLIPENGLIAFNPPLTTARLGSCSTKTVFPRFIAAFQELLTQLRIQVEIHNPLLHKTKGEVVADSANAALVKELAPHTVSCAHPTRRGNWLRKSASHCGYCVPCLYRRASLHKVGLDQGSHYGIDVLADEVALHEDVLDDFRAMLAWLNHAHIGGRDAQRIVQTMLLRPSERPLAQQVIAQGLAEMKAFVLDNGSPELLAWAGLQ